MALSPYLQNRQRIAQGLPPLKPGSSEPSKKDNEKPEKDAKEEKKKAAPKKSAKRVPVKKVSDKRKEANKVYKQIMKEMFAESDRCELKSPVCTGKAQGLDHTQKRSPKNLTDRKNLKRACNACNLYKENNQEWAEKTGNHKSRFKK